MSKDYSSKPEITEFDRYDGKTIYFKGQREDLDVVMVDGKLFFYGHGVHETYQALRVNEKAGLATGRVVRDKDLLSRIEQAWDKIAEDFKDDRVFDLDVEVKDRIKKGD